MMKIFRKSEEVIGAVVDTVDHAIATDHPLPVIPDTTGEVGASIGDDFNLVLLVKEHGVRRQHQLGAKREALLAQLKKIDKELLEIEVLINAVKSLEGGK